jgi:catechol 2,3-dioxygenase-like lactoylglutathione lyase family enzyme
MVRKFRLGSLLRAVVILVVTLAAGCVSPTEEAHNTVVGKELKKTNGKNRIRLEHVAINVEDPVRMAKWYCQNLGMKVIRKGPPPVNMHFISDSGGNMMLEVYRNPPDAVPDYTSMNPLLLHISFMVDDVKGIREKLITAGATPVGDVSVTSSGDELAMLRDPWGVAIQFVKRTEPMLQHE